EAFGVLARDLGVGLAHDRLDLARLPQHRALVERLADGHEETARHSLAGHVTDQEEDAVAVEREEVIEITADLAGWLQKRIEVEARLARKDLGSLRQAAHLDAAGRLQLPGPPGRLLAQDSPLTLGLGQSDDQHRRKKPAERERRKCGVEQEPAAEIREEAACPQQAREERERPGRGA